MTGPHMTIDRFAPAEAALKAGKVDEGIALIEAQLEEAPNAPLLIYRNFGGLLVRQKDYERAERWTAAAVKLYPKDFDLWNMLGVALRRLKRRREAIKALDQAIRINPKSEMALQNKGNVYNDLRDAAALPIFLQLVRKSPTSAELQRSLGRAYWYSGDLDKAEMRFNLSSKLQPTLTDAWLDLSSVVSEARGPADAMAILDRAIAASPGDMKLVEARALALRRSGKLREAEQHLLQLLEKNPGVAWIPFQLAGVISDYDRPRANQYFERAVELDPENAQYRVALAESYGRSRYGDEAAHVEAGYQTLVGVVDRLPEDPGALKVAYELMGRVADYNSVDKLGDFTTRGRTWAEAGRHTAFLIHLAGVEAEGDRDELVEQHRIWGHLAEASAARRPITRKAPRAPNGKIRVGFMSSDLRAHPVAYFALPLFEHYDRSKFEIYCYSFFQGEEDGLQKRIAGWVDAFRWEKEISDRDAAQMIADDQLDMLIELGASTHMNKLAVMAFKPAPLSASWLGYPHSVGLQTIDHFILDPYVVPERRELVIEEPLLMPKSWIAMGDLSFPDRPITPVIPQDRNGFLTLGTANNPYKYSRAMLRTWAKVTAAIPESRFMFLRPEGNAPSFRKNILAHFAAEGVSEDRVRFESVRGAHMPFYNDMDMSLDTFPQTGGTTTCEALFMGVPVVTLVGPAVFERLSYSILSNAGLGDLCAKTEAEFVDIAVRLAADHDRRQALRTGLRATLKASPLGQTHQFAIDFYKMIERAVNAAKAKGKIRAV
ncbi:tetratricopeptide repeat protein [soil metagenome]